MLTGRYYDNSMPFEQWKERVYVNQSLPSVLKSAGWQVHLFPKVSYSLYFSDAVASNFVRGLPIRERLLDIAAVYDISLFRAVPHFLKQAVYNQQQWVFRGWLSGPTRTRISKPAADAKTRETGPNRSKTPAQSRVTFAPTAYASNDVAFVDAALSEPRLDHRNKVFKYFHWSVPHVPLILNENLQYEGMDVSRANYKRYATAGLKLVGMFLDSLRERGIYDQSIIFVVGDHGAGIQRQQFVLQPGMPLDTGADVVTEGFKVAANALILAKPINSRGPLKISEAPAALSDIPATVFASLGMPAGVSGSSMFELGEKQDRARKFYRYSDRGYYSYYSDMTEFVVDGYGWQDTSWRRSGRVLTKNGVVSRRAPSDGAELLFGDVGSFGVAYEGFHHAEYSGDTPFYWTDGAASIRVPIEQGQRPTTLSVDVLFAVKAHLRLQILLDDCEVASETMPGGEWSKDLALTTCAPTGRWTTIRFVSETARPGNGDRRNLGVALRRVVLR
jgi:arylsulfatase A-like enzyme